MLRTAAFALAAIVAQNPPPRPVEVRPAVVVGQVVDAATGQGVRQALVRLDGAGATVTRVADDRGRFFFRGVQAGSYTITATRAGYFDGAFGRVRAGGDALALPLFEGQWKTDVSITLFRPAVISGAVDDESGEPLAGIRVQAFRRAWVGGRDQWRPSESTRTDDRGLYRLHGLMPGEYVVAVPSVQATMPVATLEEVGQTGRVTRDIMAVLNMNGGPGSAIQGVLDGSLFDPDERNMRVVGDGATPPVTESGEQLAYPTVFYPSADAPEAAVPITLDPGAERAGVSFKLDAVPTARVSGRVEGPDGPVPGLLLRLVRDGAADFGMGAETAVTISAPDGSFTFLDVPAGRFNVLARSAASALPNWAPAGLVNASPGRSQAARLSGLDELWGDENITVYDDEVADVVVTVSKGVTVAGRVAFDTQGEAPPAELSASVALWLEAAPGEGAHIPPAPVTSDGEFTISGIPPGRYVFRAEATPPGWYLKSATWGGRDMIREPFDIATGDEIADVVVTLTDRPARLAGSVYDARGMAVPGARVVVVPAGRGSGIDRNAPASGIRAVRANIYGIYELTGLSPGDYDVLAVPEEAGVAWQDPAVLARLTSQVLRVTLTDGQVVQRSIRAAAADPGR